MSARLQRSTASWIAALSLVAAGVAIAQTELLRAPGDPAGVSASQPLGMPGEPATARVGAREGPGAIVIIGTLGFLEASWLELQQPDEPPLQLAWDEDTLFVRGGERVTFDALTGGETVAVTLEADGNLWRARRVEVLRPSP